MPDRHSDRHGDGYREEQDPPERPVAIGKGRVSRRSAPTASGRTSMEFSVIGMGTW